MGSGEFDGGSSVKWEVIHSDGESGSGHPGGGKGKDKDPKTDASKFVITITGLSTPIMVPVKGTKIRIVWADPTALTESSPSPKATAKTWTRSSRKKKATK